MITGDPMKNNGLIWILGLSLIVGVLVAGISSTIMVGEVERAEPLEISEDPGTRAALSTPFYIVVHVQGADGDDVSGSTVKVENTRTDEDNLDVVDQDGDALPQVLQTNSTGTTVFIVGNLPSGFSDGDSLLVSAKKGDLTGSRTTTVDVTDDYAEVTVTLGVEEDEEAETRAADSWWSELLEDEWALGIIFVIGALLLLLWIMARGTTKGPGAGRKRKK